MEVSKSACKLAALKLRFAAFTASFAFEKKLKLNYFYKYWSKRKVNVIFCLDNGVHYNSSFAKFAMANLSGWSDKQQVGGDSANPLAFLFQKADGQSKDLVNADD